MGMTIDKAILRVEHSSMNVDDKETADFIINTMRKYQKISEIVKQKDYDRFNSHNYYGYFLRVQDIRKVLENGNDEQK